MEPTQMTDSLARMDWQGSTGRRRGLGCGLVATWKRSMLSAHRLKVATPRDVTWRGVGRRGQRRGEEGVEGDRREGEDVVGGREGMMGWEGRRVREEERETRGM